NGHQQFQPDRSSDQRDHYRGSEPTIGIATGPQRRRILIRACDEAKLLGWLELVPPRLRFLLSSADLRLRPRSTLWSHHCCGQSRQLLGSAFNRKRPETRDQLSSSRLVVSLSHSRERVEVVELCPRRPR